MSFEKIYFLQNLDGIKNFLSLYQPEESSLIVTSREFKSLHQFIQEILPNQEKITIPRIPISHLPPKELFETQISQCVTWRNRYTNYFNDIQPHAKAFFFGEFDALHFYILLSYLKEKGADIKFVRNYPMLPVLPFENQSLPPEYQSHLSRLSKTIGFRMGVFRVTTWVSLGLAECPEPMKYTPDSWKHLSEKYSWDQKYRESNAILLIDTPIQGFSMINMDVNVEETERNLIKFLSRLIDQGKSIHLKPHVDDKFKHHSLSGTSLENKVKILPRYFPVELIMNQYPEVYGVYSAALSTPIEGSVYSLGKLIVFNSIESERIFWKFHNELCEHNPAIEIMTNEFYRGDFRDQKRDEKEMAPNIDIQTFSGGNTKKSSILIPTLNRSEFLIRALDYYAKAGFKGSICIGDSSEKEHVEKTIRAIDRLSDKLKIIYHILPKPHEMTHAMCIQKLIELVPTPYTVYAGDDDFLIPSGLEKCVAFLEDNPDYSAAHGLRIKVKLQNSGASGPLESGYYVPEQKYEFEKASDRWIGYMRNAFSTQYYVHRTETWRRMYRDAGSFELVHYLGEVLVCSHSVISGKIKSLDCLSSVFQINDNLIFSWDETSLFSLINEANWSSSIDILEKSIVEALVQQDGIDKRRAEGIFERELWQHITGILLHQFQKKYTNPKIVKPNNMLSPLLLDPENPFYSDFKEVYMAITENSLSIEDQARALNQEGEELFSKGDAEGALNIFTRAVETDPTSATAHNNLGALYWELEEFYKALGHFMKALEIDPNDRDTILNCADIFKTLDKPEDAKEIYSAYLERNPGDEMVIVALNTLERS